MLEASFNSEMKGLADVQASSSASWKLAPCHWLFVQQPHNGSNASSLQCRKHRMHPVKMRLHDASNISNVGHLYDVTHYVAIVHLANDKCQASNVGTGTHSVACQFFVSHQMMFSVLEHKLWLLLNVCFQCWAI